MNFIKGLLLAALIICSILYVLHMLRRVLAVNGQWRENPSMGIGELT